ncbi:MAG: hypothetical protein DRH33_09155 [Candidatus Nealsonbacteria bacterium]|nr:MAG: hypothetical protein DRH33_09155 [Candidatus Nealsonbacteria bacterium]
MTRDWHPNPSGFFRNGKGIAYGNLGEYSEAIENYTKAIGLYPSYF